MPTTITVAETTTAPRRVDPADFIADLHAEGNFPITAGGDPAVPDSLGDDPGVFAVYTGGRKVPAHEAAMIAAHGPSLPTITATAG